MTDIVERLKQGPVGRDDDMGVWCVDYKDTESVMHKAAEEIEWLAKRCKSLETALTAIRDDKRLDAELCRNVASMALRGDE